MPTRTEIPGLLLMLSCLCQLCPHTLQGEKKSVLPFLALLMGQCSADLSCCKGSCLAPKAFDRPQRGRTWALSAL